MSSTTWHIPVTDLGRMSYAAAYDVQVRTHERVLAGREAQGGPIAPGEILFVEHDPPVITVSKRESARAHLVATEAQLRSAGVEVAETDRGGDITYHGPGQLVAYPIIDLNFFKLGLHEYMRLLEAAVIATVSGFGLAVERDATATGVWVPREGGGSAAKIAAMGVRVRKWVSMHGLALNVTTDLSHFQLIVPCGLAGRPVTSLRAELGEACPAMGTVKSVLSANLIALLTERARSLDAA